MEDKNGHKIDEETGALAYDLRCDICFKESLPQKEIENSHDRNHSE